MEYAGQFQFPVQVEIEPVQVEIEIDDSEIDALVADKVNEAIQEERERVDKLMDLILECFREAGKI